MPSPSRTRGTPIAHRAHSPEPSLLVVSVGCPAGIGPEVSVRAAANLPKIPCVLVGDAEVIARAAELSGVSSKKLVPFDGSAPSAGRIAVLQAGPRLSRRDLNPSRPSPRAGEAQLAYIERAYELVAKRPERALVTGPVSKAAIAHSGLARARGFLGHTEWLRDLDGKRASVMCFHSEKLVSALVTTHLPISAVPQAIRSADVATASVELARLLLRLGTHRPEIAICSLNPHAGESELLGKEERRAILPGIEAAQRKLGKTALLVGPVGAETAFRKAHAGGYDGVIAMYHDQATIPMKLVAFGDAVNVTLGLSIVRTSVDHGTAYDIAWKGQANASGMEAAMKLAARLVETQPPATRQPKRLKKSGRA
ncbi:MAG TPA: 4-hydroxythreonine-4-phosphate dehydrogenase PdxA [Polyangiaceae bacterium]|nr:4-hydroxythreonine-4-phosphate dehydrogenase PdxA [Polyangiaceae bacterium]